MVSIKIIHTDRADLLLIYGLFEASVIYQRQKGYPTWEHYDKNAIVRDIENGNQYKIVVDSKIALVFSVGYSDKIIWRHHDDNKSIYLHRIVVNADFKGQKLFGHILNWSKDHIKEKGLDHIRMDTWAANSNIIEYYKGFGFEVVEDYTTPDTEELPVHNRNLALTLLEYKSNTTR